MQIIGKMADILTSAAFLLHFSNVETISLNKLLYNKYIKIFSNVLLLSYEGVVIVSTC